jgi:hypothetical protein
MKPSEIITEDEIENHWAIKSGDWCSDRLDRIKAMNIPPMSACVLYVLWIVTLLPAAYALSSIGFYLINRKLNRATKEMDRIRGWAK